jgi:O-antigen ligase
MNSSADARAGAEAGTRAAGSVAVVEDEETAAAAGAAARAQSRLSRWLDGAIIFWLFALAFFAPHSIAATQISWMCGLVLWVLRLCSRPRVQFRRTPVDYALLGFFILSFISSIFSYDQIVSLGKLRGASLFTIVYLVAMNVRSRRVVRWLALALVASCMITVVYTMAERVRGRGVKIEGVRNESPLAGALFRNGETLTPNAIRSGDTILEVDGRKIRSPEELVAALEGGETAIGTRARVKIYRVEWMPVLEVERGRLLGGETPAARLGIESWARGRDWRAAGFYGHYVTYAEALQLITSLAFGLFIALPKRRGLSGTLLSLALAGLSVALLLTVTRASWVSLLLSAFVVVLAGTGRRTAVVVAACALPLVLSGWFILKQQRNVGFYDQADQSMTWRQTVWREGFGLLLSEPRHLLVGVGMDSIKRHWREWGLFEGGRLPMGHFHSTPLQLAVERGVPALIAWLLLVGLYARMLWRMARAGVFENWIERGLVLGALGGLAGFFLSGLVHYNLGDSEVAMIFYLIMGLTLALNNLVGRDLARSPE